MNPRLRTFWYIAAIFLFITMLQAGVMDEPTAFPNGDFHWTVEPGKCVLISVSAAEDKNFSKPNVESVEYVRGLTQDEFEFCQGQGWITSGVVLPADLFWKLDRPLVYVFLKNSLPLYVGMARAGLTRPLSKKHGAAIARANADEVRLYFCESPKHVHALEAYLISKFQPSENSRGVYE
jgi:hypothetical protein